jgi:hypothetical protein
MKPNIIVLQPYGDHRDAKTLNYAYDLDFSKIIYNLDVADCAFILGVLYKNILQGEDVAEKNLYDTIAHYEVFERGTERWADVVMKTKDDTLKHLTFRLRTDTETKWLAIAINVHCQAEASASIMIYEYFKKKVNHDNWDILEDEVSRAFSASDLGLKNALKSRRSTYWQGATNAYSHILEYMQKLTK